MSGYVLDASVAVTALTAPGSPAAHLLSGATRPSRFRRFSMRFGIAGSTVSQRGYQVIQAAGLQLADDA